MLSTRVASVVLACCVAACAARGDAIREPLVPTDPRVDLAALEARTVRVGALCPDGEGWGSGVVLRTSYVATAAHVADPKCRLTVHGVPARIVARDEDHDVAIIWIASRRRWTDIQPSRVYRGQAVVLVGYPREYSDSEAHLAVSPGFVTTKLDKLYRVNTPTAAGNSGGPVFDNAGRLVGLYVSTWGMPVPNSPVLPFGGAYYATPAVHVFRLLATL